MHCGTVSCSDFCCSFMQSLAVSRSFLAGCCSSVSGPLSGPLWWGLGREVSVRAEAAETRRREEKRREMPEQLKSKSIS